MRAVRLTFAWALVLGAGGAFAAPPQDLNARVTRLEQQLSNQTLVDMHTRIDSLQREVQQLRGLVEEQAHAIEGLQRRQRELYMDVDRRLARLEREAGTGAGVVPAPGGLSTPGAAPEAPTEAEPAATAQEREAYQKAFDLLRELRYEQAAAAFRDFLKNYPQGRYAHIAQYWLGEAAYAQRNFKQAITEYQKLLDNYPKSPKLAEALLKIGYSHNELGDRAAATRVLNELVKRYPDSTEAGQARNLLGQFRREG
ncbi:MAG: tol-pal system protein YbgF [Gammaproteobacteria bacterium]|nr:tol-pal system protein YbgF [Gammaproteobacteria bacterium]